MPAEQVNLAPMHRALLYLFRLDGLLTEEHRLAIDVSSGVARVYPAEPEHAIVAGTYLNVLETCLFITLVLSHLCAVASYQMRALYKLYQGKGERVCAVQEDDDDQSVRDVITACNLKLTPLAMAITAIDQESSPRDRWER
jgi:hypothetical protein